MSWALPKVVNEEHIKHSCVCMCLIWSFSVYITWDKEGLVTVSRGWCFQPWYSCCLTWTVTCPHLTKLTFFSPLVVFDIQVSLPELVLSCLWFNIRPTRRFGFGPNDEHDRKTNAALCKGSVWMRKGRCGKGRCSQWKGCKEVTPEPCAQPVLSSEILKMKQIEQFLVLRTRLLLLCVYWHCSPSHRWMLL